MRSPLRSQSGQASLEYTVVLGIVAVVLVLAGAVVTGPGIANAVGLGVRRALCVVSGGPCLVAEAHPCVVRSTGTEGKVTAKLAFFRLGRGMGLLRAERSDGSVLLTLLDNLETGVEAGLGAEGHLRLGHVDLDEGGVAQFEAIARLGGGRSWEAPDAPSANRLQRRLIEILAGRGASSLPGVGFGFQLAQRLLGRGEHRSVPAPDAVVVEAGASVTASGELGASKLEVSLGATAAVREDRRTGRRTYLLRLNGEAAAAVASEVGSARGDGQLTLAYTVDRAGTPLELSVAAQVVGGGRLGLPAELDHKTHGGPAAQLQLTASLDLSDPDDLAAAERLLNAGPHTATAVPALLDVARRLADHGRVDVSRYAVDRQGYGGGGEVAAGPKVGFDVTLSRSAQRLRDAWSRPLGGVWERRVDCLPA